MFGVLTIRQGKPLLKCGFKYVELNPRMNIFDARKSIEYKGKSYSYEDSDKLVLQIDEQDITNESMTKITISHCNIFNGFISSGEFINSSQGCRRIIVNHNYELYPIIKRKSTGPMSYRRDQFCYDLTNFIGFTVKWNGTNITREINKSVGYEVDDCVAWKQLEVDHPVLYSFLKPSSFAPNLPGPQLSQEGANESHLRRFKLKYGHDLNLVNPSRYTSMDVIDLSAINEIRITNPKDLDTYPVYEITTKRLIHKGTGFSQDAFSKMNKHQLEKGHKPQLFMLVTNSCSHKIEVSNRRVLTITTVNEKSAGQRQVLFIKFDEEQIQRYNRDLLIDKLSI